MISYSLEMEERLAARAAFISWEAYQALPGSQEWAGDSGLDSKAMLIAVFRAQTQIEQERR